jgi:hypothetical protein
VPAPGFGSSLARWGMALVIAAAVVVVLIAWLRR